MQHSYLSYYIFCMHNTEESLRKIIWNILLLKKILTLSIFEAFIVYVQKKAFPRLFSFANLGVIKRTIIDLF